MISPLCRAGLHDTPEEFNSAMATPPQCHRVEWRMVQEQSFTVQMVTHLCSLCSSARCTRIQSRTGACTILQSLTVQMATLHNVTEWRMVQEQCKWQLLYNVTEWRITVQMATPLSSVPSQYYRALQCKWQPLHNGSGVMWTRRQRQYMGTGSSGLLQCYTQISMKDKSGVSIHPHWNINER